MVTYLDFEGTAAYRFKVVDNDTIDVTELEGQVEDDMWTWTNGDTAPFTRVSGSTINKENKPFALTGDMIDTWASSGLYPLSAEVSIPFSGTYELNTNGTYIMSFEYQFPEAYGGTQNEISKGVYSIIDNKILVYIYEDAPEDESPISLSTFTITGNTATTDTEGWVMNWTRQ